jgi:EAL domain-containing protein (putative c-di-GMP-specific phosphodiesterase class I)/AmiR/NasT family two-component response regulator
MSHRRPRNEETHVPCSQLRFLIVEDHPVQRRVLRTLLTRLGAEAVHEAEDGRQALDVIRDPRRPIDIVISDLSMPGMDGMELIRNLAAAGSRLALILNSALSPTLLSSVANMAVAYKVNLLGVIGKPVAALKVVPLVALYREIRAKSDRNRFSLASIAQALSNNEFEPLFEARVNLATTQVVGFHATAAWRHPTEGLLKAADFMDSAQAYGLRDNLSFVILHKSIEECRRWQDANLELTLSVSLAFTSLGDPDLARRVADAAADAGVEPSRIVVGVAEAAVDTERAQALETMARLRMTGFGLGVEDFGSGTMWAEQLGKVSFTELHVGANVVSGMKGDQSAQAGLVVALDTAENLRLAAVAKGIGSIDQWNMLQGWGCTYGQGPFISPALSAVDVLPWLETRGSRARAFSATGGSLDLAEPTMRMPLEGKG